MTVSKNIPEQQGHNPTDAEQFAGFGCLGFIITCVALALWWAWEIFT